MRLLFNQNISFRITKKLIDLFPYCKHVSDCRLMNSEYPVIWEYARKNNYSPNNHIILCSTLAREPEFFLFNRKLRLTSYSKNY